MGRTSFLASGHYYIFCHCATKQLVTQDCNLTVDERVVEKHNRLQHFLNKLSRYVSRQGYYIT